MQSDPSCAVQLTGSTPENDNILGLHDEIMASIKTLIQFKFLGTILICI